MRTVLTTVAAVSLIVLGLAAPASAQQSLTVNLGYFAVRGDDARVDGDVLLADQLDALPLFFQTSDFNSGMISGEWLFPVTDFLEAGVGIGFYQRTVFSVYDTREKEDGSEIAQDLKLRMTPFTATFRFLPLGHNAPVQPYIGAGVAAINWRYSEIGEFVDPSDDSIFPGRFVAKGTDIGPVIFGGIRLPIGDHFSTGGEIRYQKASGSLPAGQFVEGATKIDLGGISYSALLQFKF
jgi:hypothetical protein